MMNWNTVILQKPTGEPQIGDVTLYKSSRLNNSRHAALDVILLAEMTISFSCRG